MGMDERLHPLFPKKYVISESEGPAAIASKVYYALLLNRIRQEVLKILSKNQNCFQKNRSITSQILTSHRIIGV